MPIQIIPKPREKKSLLPDLLFYFSIIIFLASISSYFILNNMIGKTAAKIQEIDSAAAALSASSLSSLETEIFALQKKINTFGQIFNNRRYISQVFPFIEKLAHPDVIFLNFTVDITKNSVKFSGIADSFQAVEQQSEIFKKESMITSLKLSGVSLGTEGKIPFDFELILNPKVFAK
jgi:hypothetical protein